MTTTTPHPYAHILRAIADGKNVQWQNPEGIWMDQPNKWTLKEIAMRHHTPDRFRVEPPHITINNHKVPEPLRDCPQPGTTVYVPDLTKAGATDEFEWTACGWQCRALTNGLLHLTPKAARAHAEALISFTGWVF